MAFVSYIVRSKIVAVPMSLTETGPKVAPNAKSEPNVRANEHRTRIAGRLGQTELRRRIWHISPGLLPFLLWPIPHADPISPTLRGIIVLTCAIIAGLIYLRFHRVARQSVTSDRAGAVLGYAGSVLLTLLFFPANAELGLTVLAILAFGDGSATLGGLLLAGPKIPWNRSKTWAGTICFLACGVPMATVVYWGETYFNAESHGPPVPFLSALLCGGTAVLLAAIAESFPSRINDNIRVGVTAAVSLVVMHFLVVGVA
jgi:farnesol kinase